MWAFCLIAVSFAAVPSHRVTSLPGWSQPLPSAIYSGFFPSNQNQTHFQHYFLVESESDPKNDPIVIWYQGGPGGPSLFGAFVENGPFVLDDRSLENMKNGVPSLNYNPFGWQKFANLLFITAPAPVGFSYCTDNCGTVENPWHDKDFGPEQLTFLKNFLTAYPELAGRDLYISGESYAGVYIPEAVNSILDDSKLPVDQRVGPKVNLKGFMIGNGCMGTEAGICVSGPPPAGGNLSMNYVADYMMGHNQISRKMYNKVYEVCGSEALADGSYIHNAACNKNVAKMFDQIGGFFVYDLYDTCMGKNDSLTSKYTHLTYPTPSTPSYKLPGAMLMNDLTAGQNDYRCGGMTAFNIYSNLTQLATALNVPPGDPFFAIDDGWPGYQWGVTDLRPWYKEKLPGSGLRILIYSGDVDACVLTSWTEGWINDLNWAETDEWRPWTLDGAQQVAGHVTKFDHNLNFVTVRGAGHLVPLTKPAEASLAIRSFLKEIDLPGYVKPPTPGFKSDL